MIAAGKHKAHAVRGMFAKTKKGDEQVIVSFELSEGAHQGERIVWRGSFSENKCGATTVAQRTLDSLTYCGWDGDTEAGVYEYTDEEGIKRQEQVAYLTPSIATKDVILVVEHEEYEGKTSARVAWVNSADGGGALLAKNTMSADEGASFAARLKAKMLAKKANSGGGAQAPAQTNGRPAAAQDATKDVPF